MKKLKCKVIYFCVFIITISICWLRYYEVNNKYSEPIIEHYSSSEVVNYNGINIHIKNVRWLNYQDIKEENLLKYIPFREDISAIFVDVHLENVSGIGKSIEPYLFQVESLDWYNGVNFEIYKTINSALEKGNIELFPNSSISVTLPFVMIESQFDSKSWKQRMEREYNFMVSLYPVKKMIDIEINK